MAVGLAWATRAAWLRDDAGWHLLQRRAERLRAREPVAKGLGAAFGAANQRRSELQQRDFQPREGAQLVFGALLGPEDVFRQLGALEDHLGRHGACAAEVQ